MTPRRARGLALPEALWRRLEAFAGARDLNVSAAAEVVLDLGLLAAHENERAWTLKLYDGPRKAAEVRRRHGRR